MMESVFDNGVKLISTVNAIEKPKPRRESYIGGDIVRGLESDARELENNRLLFVELPYALNNVLNLLEKVKAELEPSFHDRSKKNFKVDDDDDEIFVDDIFEGKTSSSSHIHNNNNNNNNRKNRRSYSTSSGRKIPSPLQFVRLSWSERNNNNNHKKSPLSSSSSSTSSVTLSPPPSPPGKKYLVEHGLHMAHVHSNKGNTSQTSNSVSSGLRNLTKKGIHMAQGAATSSAAPSLSYSSSPNTWMDVSLHMDGFYVRHAKVDLRMQKPSKTLMSRKAGFVSSGSHLNFSTQLHQPQNPWVLDQIQVVYEKTIEQIQKIKSWQEKREQAQANSVLEESLFAQTCLHDVLVALIQSRNAMTNPSPNSFPQTLRNSENTIGCEFQPAPPPELLLEFSIHLDELIVSAYELNYISSPKRCSQVEHSWVETCDYTNKVFKFNESGKNGVQVVDQVQVHFKVHSLQWILEHLYEAYNTSIKMLRKLESFNKHQVAVRLAQQGPNALPPKFSEKLEYATNLPPVTYSNWIRD